MKALVWLSPERMEIREVEQPRPGPGEVLVKTEAAGICGSEVESYMGRMSNRTPPLVMGHWVRSFCCRRRRELRSRYL